MVSTVSVGYAERFGSPYRRTVIMAAFTKKMAILAPSGP